MIERQKQGSEKMEGKDDQRDDDVEEGEHHRDEQRHVVLIQRVKKYCVEIIE